MENVDQRVIDLFEQEGYDITSMPKALAKYIKSGKVKDAGVDVFPHEPTSNKEPFVSELQNLPFMTQY